jgi:hypothetical protein
VVKPILAFDPGSKNSGIVLRHGEKLLGWGLEVRPGTARLPDGSYLRQVVHGGLELLRTASIDPADRDGYVVAVESIEWWPRKGQPRNERGNYGTAMVLGAVLLRWPDAIVVDSGRGVANLHPQAYPPQIRPPVNGKGKDRLKDVRASWDHSYAGETLYLQRVRARS